MTNEILIMANEIHIRHPVADCNTAVQTRKVAIRTRKVAFQTRKVAFQTVKVAVQTKKEAILRNQYQAAKMLNREIRYN